MKKIIVFALVMIFSLFCFSCHKNQSIEMAENDCINIAPDIEWAVIAVPYAAFRTDCSYTSEVCANARKGEIFMVIGKKSVKEVSPDVNEEMDKNIWYHFEEGWLDSNLVRIFDTRLKAESAVNNLH